MCYEITSRPVKPVLAFLALVRLERHAEALARSAHDASIFRKNGAPHWKSITNMCRRLCYYRTAVRRQARPTTEACRLQRFFTSSSSQTAGWSSPLW